MRALGASGFKKWLLGGTALFGLIALVLSSILNPGFDKRWRGLKDGMDQSQVRQLLGKPTSIGTTSVLGAGNRPVTRWEYKRGHLIYSVDFDYIGPGAAPAVFRTELDSDKWKWPWWWPWQRAQARA